jgi:PBP1b-binding outer membrane lipoprotein LpoB
MKNNLLVSLILVVALFFAGCSKTPTPSTNEVVIYVSQDRVFSEPVLKA